MKTIEKLLKEYRIRFNVTEEIDEKSYPFDSDHKITDSFVPEIKWIGGNAGHMMFNKNGMVFYNDTWATAKITEKPEKWVVEKDESHPMWEKCFDWLVDNVYRYNYRGEDSRYFGMQGHGDNLLAHNLSQYLTIDQWAELFLDEGINFSIIDNNPSGWFYVRMKDRKRGCLVRYIYQDNQYIYSKTNYDTETEYFVTTLQKTFLKEMIDEFRLALKEEVEIVKEKYPEYFEPIEGNYCIFFESSKSIHTIRKLKMVRTYTNGSKSYIDSNGVAYSNCKNLTKELHDSILKFLIDENL